MIDNENQNSRALAPKFSSSSKSRHEDNAARQLQCSSFSHSLYECYGDTTTLLFVVTFFYLFQLQDQHTTSFMEILQ